MTKKRVHICELTRIEWVSDTLPTTRMLSNITHIRPNSSILKALCRGQKKFIYLASLLTHCFLRFMII